MTGGVKETQDLALGSIVEGRFRINDLLGRGGFATVYQGQQLSVDRPVAIKVLDPVGRGMNDADLRERFVQEAKIAAKLEHPNTVRIFDYGMTEQGRSVSLWSFSKVTPSKQNFKKVHSSLSD